MTEGYFQMEPEDDHGDIATLTGEDADPPEETGEPPAEADEQDAVEYDLSEGKPEDYYEDAGDDDDVA